MNKPASELIALADRISGHLGPFNFITRAERELVVQVLRTAANQSGSERAGVDALREALKPFADAVYSDNGDVTLSTSYIKTADYLRARNVYRSLATPPAQPAPAATHGDGYCGCTERCKDRDNCQYDVKPEDFNNQDEVLLAYGLLWCVNTSDKRVHSARRELLKCLNRELQAKAISAARQWGIGSIAYDAVVELATRQQDADLTAALEAYQATVDAGDEVLEIEAHGARIHQCCEGKDMSKTALLELADRVEKVGGYDQTLDSAISIAIGDKDSVEREDAFGNIWMPGVGCASYTSSLDAAMTLVPENFSCETAHSAAPASLPNLQFTRCRLWDWRRGPLAIDPANEWRAEGNRPLPLNVVAAALRARAQQMEG